MRRYVFDTSALLCYLRDEPGSHQVYKILRSKESLLHMHRVNLGELHYGIMKKDGEEKANEVLGILIQYPIQFVNDLSDPFLVTTSRFKVDHGLGFADAFAAATALLNKAVLVTKDNDFRTLTKKKILEVFWI